MKVYLDDIRLPAADGWTVVRTKDEAIKLLETGQVEELSLDHDLGADDALGTGYDVLRWMEGEVVLNDFKPPGKMNIHSANPAATARMEAAVKKIQELWEQRTKP